MSRSIQIEAGPRKRHVTIDGVGIGRTAYDVLTVNAGDVITIEDAAWVPSVVSELAPSDVLIATMSEGIIEDPIVITDHFVAFDASNSVNGSRWVWAASSDDFSAARLVPSDFAWTGTVEVSSDWGGGWCFELLYGNGHARIADLEDGAETGAVVLPRAVGLAEAFGGLAGRVNRHEALSSRNRRRFAMCRVCAEAGVGSADLNDSEERWHIDVSVVDSCDEAAKASLLNALWTPCAEHRSTAMEYFGSCWSWGASGWMGAEG